MKKGLRLLTLLLLAKAVKIVGSKPRPDEEGIETISVSNAHLLSPSSIVPNLDLMKKGLRPAINSS